MRYLRRGKQNHVPPLSQPEKLRDSVSYSDVSKELLDIGKRASDIINLHITALTWEEIQFKFVAIRLSDGGSDNVLYDSKRDAIRHQVHEQQCAYVALRNMPTGSNPRDMAIYLKFNRDAYLSGMRLVNPEDQFGGPDLMITAKRYEHERLIAGFPRVAIPR